MKDRDVFNVELDKEEQQITDVLDKLIDKGELKSVPDLVEQMVQAKIVATNTLHKFVED